MRDLGKALGMLRQYEGLRLRAYQDSIGVWTIGYGTTLGVHPGMVITKEQAESLLEIDVKHRAELLGSWIHVPVTDNQMSAMISLAYNIGMKAIHHSRLLTHVNAGLSKKECAKDFMSWVHAGGQILPGLITRRKAEAVIFIA